MNKRFLSAALFLSLIGCEEGDSSTSESESAPFSVWENWETNSLEITVDAPEGSTYHLGIVETGESCDYGLGNCWTGEDCFQGYNDLVYCHPVGSEGLSLRYGGDFQTLEEGNQTVFEGQSNNDGVDFDGSVTFMLESDEDGSCWAWGDDPSYYADLGCQQL